MASSPDAPPSSSSEPLSYSSSTWTMEKVTGMHRFKIAEYKLVRAMGAGWSVRSGIFNVGGYDWSLVCHPNGTSEDTAHIFFVVFGLENDVADSVKVRVEIVFLDENGEPSRFLGDRFVQEFSRSHPRRGPAPLGRIPHLEAAQFIQNDCLTIQCTVSILKSPHVQVLKTPSVAVPPSDLHRQFGRLLEDGAGTDVTFQVGAGGGEAFSAHRCVLAARSPVFKAKFFGPMEGSSAERVKIDDIEPAAFKALLYFIYSDSLPPQMEEIDEESAVSMAQHLLVAADRYGLERLKILCEDKLCRGIDVNTVATTLAIADQHLCSQLKAACFDFVVSSRILTAVMETDGFEHLRMSCPSVVKELLKKVNS
ncbi:BTB/POZ and MATH domain-containing protein 2-like [Ananas comosus]|uniref:BTB/POZ and MATH domain-containing protein 2 n=1 Tax=Ananas comosus TaxID=4615 RepID=A0A199VFQ2_ANACO|nr:BTB/POZ and MATH domain-containing protein 2-like [Ananas comosus]OAY75942.1 BTB/POZ and MATH domain-containing protein 2 [Ananas comosus]